MSHKYVNTQGWEPSQGILRCWHCSYNTRASHTTQNYCTILFYDNSRKSSVSLTPHFHEDDPYQKQKMTNVDQGVEEKEPSCTVSGNAAWPVPMENKMEIPQNIKNRPTV